MTYPAWTAAERERVVSGIESGLPLRIIGRRIGRSVGAITTYLHEQRISVQALRRSARVYTAREVARLFGVPHITVQAWIARGWLKTRRNQSRGRQRPDHIISSARIDAFLAQRDLWPAWDPALMTDAGWRAEAEMVRARAGGRWLSTKEVGAQLGYAPATVAGWARTGALAGVASARHGRHLYLWSADLERWTPPLQRAREAL